ncbi:PAC2 family protein [Chloroflexota bacterium]
MELNDNFPFKFYGKPEFQSSVLVIGWNEDAGKLGEMTVDYLHEKLGCTEFGEVETADFFPSSGTSGANHVTRLPESKFYCCKNKNLVLFMSSPPRFEWYRFIDSVLHMAEYYCHTKELYTVGGMAASCAHTTPRKFTVTVNSPDLEKILSQSNLTSNIVIKTSPGQRPTLNSFLLWLAKRRNIIGADLMVSVPYYLTSVGDPQACRKPSEFLDRRLNLGIDFQDLDKEAVEQNKRVSQLRIRFPEIDDYIHKLEINKGLTPEENEKLVKKIRALL